MTTDSHEATGIAYTSIKTPNGYTWSFTVRTPISEEMNNDLIAEIKRLEDVFKTAEWTYESNKPNYSKGFQKPLQTVIDPNAPICPFHNKPMTKRTGQYGDFYTCSTKMPDGSWCPYKPEKKNPATKSVTTVDYEDY